MRIFLTIVFLSLFYCVPAGASYFEYCLISGKVISKPKLQNEEYTFQVHVLSSIATSCLGAESYFPEACNSYANQKYEISLPKSWLGELKIGTRLDLIQQKFDDVKGNRYVSLRLAEDCK